MNLKKKLPLLISVVLLICLLCVSYTNSSQSDKKEVVATADSAVEIDQKEMRGIWITYMELSMENETDKSEKAFREKFDYIAKKSKDCGFNTLIVQVRPFSDALYNSKYFPWSHIISGTQGKNPGYDPLKIICEICDEYDLSIHAWINPYRIKSEKIPVSLAEDNPYVEDKSLGKTTETGIYLDPSNVEARELIINGITEIIENYEVDGIQFDDYFYPTTSADFDSEEYNAYVEYVGVENSMSLENWRKANVNILICDVYRAVHNSNKDIVFGISPQGNIKNNESLYAEVQAWCSCRGFVDYICPQIYFSLENPALTFEDALNSWCNFEFDSNVTLYIGLAGYKAGGDSDDGTWKNSNDILAKEYNILYKNKRVEGFMLYSFETLENDNARKEIENLIKALK